MATSPRSFGTVERRPSRSGKAPRYRAFYTGPDGQRHRAPATYETRGEAEAFLRIVLRDIRDGVWTERSGWPAEEPAAQQAPAAPVLADWIASSIDARATRTVRPIKQGTVYNYQRLAKVLDGAFPGVRVDELTPQLVAAWHAGAAKATPTQTANAYLLLRSVMDDAVKAGLVASNPCQVAGANGKPEPKHKAEALTPTELVAYLEACPAWARLPLLVAGTCALRSGEVRALQRRDVDTGTGRIQIQREVVALGKGKGLAYDTPKSKAGRRAVYTPAVVAAALRSHVLTLPRGREQLLFPSRRDPSAPMVSSVLWEAHAKGRDAIGRPTFRVHDLRATAATTLARNGATVRELMVALGHTTPQVAMVYQAAEERRLSELATRVDAGLGGVADVLAG